MHFTSLVLRIWWEPGWGFRASVRGIQGQEPIYFKSLEELNTYLGEHALRLKPKAEDNNSRGQRTESRGQ